eukprot:10828-Heterococcus_DN1.PRE.2
MIVTPGERRSLSFVLEAVAMLASGSHLHRRLAVPVVLSIGTCLLSSFVYKLRKRQRAAPLKTRAAACVVHDAGSAALSDLLTVIVTTSPIPSNPDTSMLNYLLESLQKVPGLSECRTIITADGYTEGGVKKGNVRYKKGRLTPPRVVAYEQFRSALRALADSDDPLYKTATVLSFEQRQGFGHAVMHALQATQTQFALVSSSSEHVFTQHAY